VNFGEKAESFLKISTQFRLGDIDTEKPHPKTKELSSLAKTDLPAAITILKDIDINALEIVKDRKQEITGMKKDIENTFMGGHKVFLAGCGSTGRLSIVLEVLWREEKRGTRYENAVISFMAGGDTALIKSIENFEDYPGYAARQLKDLGFSDGDLLIACTEGGETPYVIGATENAAVLSSKHPYFLYCNPDKILEGLTERTTRILRNPYINRINLQVGPMALSGSTRMQASTVLMYAVGLALLNAFSEYNFESDIDQFINHIREIDYNFLIPYIEKESSIYNAGSYIVYTTYDDLGISILTDTTERSPTFTLHPFENFLNAESKPSLVYLCLPNAPDSKSAWRMLLSRDPRPLDWKEFPVTAESYLYGFDFSRKGLEKRKQKISPSSFVIIDIRRETGQFKFEFQEEVRFVSTDGLSLLNQHLLLKMLLNILSTLVMGKLGRYESNLMTYVTPSNNKLIDRAVRYVGILLERKEISASYEQIVYALFEEIDSGIGTRSLVIDTAARFIERSNLRGRSKDLY
jgi:N-acetylmuramic acid 6-phosphate etherase